MAEPQRPAIFNHVEVDVDAWERDGYMAFPGILTPAATAEALAAVQRVQAKSDAIIMDTDWNSLDWGSVGLPPLPKHVSEEQKASMCGGCELSMSPPGSLFPPGWGALPSKGAGRVTPGDPITRSHKSGQAPVGRRFAERPGLPMVGKGYDGYGQAGGPFPTHGFLPASFPPAYDDFLLNLASHPQMLEIHKKMIGSDYIRFDHSLLMNRPPRADGGPGRTWHSHPYDQDGWGVTKMYTGLGLVWTLVYPEGSSLELGGSLGVVPGYHLFRDPFKWNTVRPDTDEGMLEYIEGMTHPLTGEPLEIKHLDLPPGSLVSIPAHMPHYVAPRKEGAGMRWGLLLTYRQPDPTRRLPSISRSLPDSWIESHLAGQTRELFREY